MRRTISVTAVIAVVMLAIFGAIMWRNLRTDARAEITLPDGTIAWVSAVTYGTNHIAATGLERVAAKLPRPVRHVVEVIAGRSGQWMQKQRTTSEPKLVVWLNLTNLPAPGARSGYYEAFLVDETGFVSGSSETLMTYSPSTTLDFKVFPRTSERILLQVYARDMNGEVTVVGRLPIRNPAVRMPKSAATETLPATHAAGDLEVTLNGLITGHDSHTSYHTGADGKTKVTRGTNRNDGRNYTYCDLTIRSPRTNEVWKVAGEELSDTTGNRAGNNSMSWESGSASFAFMPSLWLTDKAWKIKLQLKRDKGFTTNEQFTFQKVPLGEMNKTNLLGWKTNFGGVTITLAHLVRRPPMTNDSWNSSQLTSLEFDHSALPENVHLDLTEARITGGEPLNSGSWSSSSTHRSYEYRNVPTNAVTADFIFVVQQGRMAEFVVKPEVAGAGVTSAK